MAIFHQFHDSQNKGRKRDRESVSPFMPNHKWKASWWCWPTLTKYALESLLKDSNASWAMCFSDANYMCGGSLTQTHTWQEGCKLIWRCNMSPYSKTLWPICKSVTVQTRFWKKKPYMMKSLNGKMSQSSKPAPNLPSPKDMIKIQDTWRVIEAHPNLDRDKSTHASMYDINKFSKHVITTLRAAKRLARWFKRHFKSPSA